MADDITPLASLSLTHVYYNPNDPISLLCAWLALVPQALCVVYVTLIWSTREAEVALMFAGQLACEAVNFALKRLIKEERPRHIHTTGGKGYGMPSSHSQFAFFWAVALGLFLLARHRPPPTKNSISHDAAAASTMQQQQTGTGSPPAAVAAAADDREGRQRRQRAVILLRDIERFAHEPWSFAQRAAVSVVALGLACAVAWSRIYLGYHTPKQVLAGVAAGSVSAVGWFAITYMVRQAGLLVWALEMPVARWFRLRDLVVEEDLCQAGWEKWETQRLASRQQQSETKKRKTT
ncbi:phosphatidic acid phosphatase type 2/haloperoxidase [Podospora didyma]|uniref:Dolichyldiphosphatase n=1 Tax=Podospora didyma TaxID=330526 RepID=A0AAE0KKR4_9PEZI|nr:phosphatidic acid phosphatase type 2/haloperoxidase [Podospora didyma]